MSDRKDADMERTGHGGAQAERTNTKDEGHRSGRGGMYSVTIGKSPEWSRGTSRELSGVGVRDGPRLILVGLWGAAGWGAIILTLP